MTSLVTKDGGLIDQEEIESDTGINELCREASARAYEAEINSDAGQAISYLENCDTEDIETALEYSDEGYLAADKIYGLKHLGE
jgi:hypothetical protein